MQLDRTEIVIRQRSSLELLDLSLVVLRKHVRSIMLTSALLGIPLLVIDVLMTSWMLGDEAFLVAEDLDSPRIAMRWRQGFHLVLLYALQFPLALWFSSSCFSFHPSSSSSLLLILVLCFFPNPLPSSFFPIRLLSLLFLPSFTSSFSLFSSLSLSLSLSLSNYLPFMQKLL